MKIFNKAEMCTELLKVKSNLDTHIRKEITNTQELTEYLKNIQETLFGILSYIGDIKYNNITTSALDIVELEILAVNMYIITLSSLDNVIMINVTKKNLISVIEIINDYTMSKGEIAPTTPFIYKEIELDIIIDLDNNKFNFSEMKLILDIQKFIEINFIFNIYIKKGVRLYNIPTYNYLARINNLAEDYDIKYIYIKKVLYNYIMMIVKLKKEYKHILIDIYKILKVESNLNKQELDSTLSYMENQFYKEIINEEIKVKPRGKYKIKK